MAPAKRAREVIDLTGDDEPSIKHRRTPGSVHFHGLSSQNSRSASSRPSHGSRSTPTSTASSSQYPGSSQILIGDDDETDLTQDDANSSSLELYGTLDNKIVGCRYYNGLVTPGELVILKREPQNEYDPNAVRVDNVMGRQIGHLPRKVVEKLVPYMDSSQIVVEGVLAGEKEYFDCPIRLYLYGTSYTPSRLALEEKLKSDRLLKVTQMKKTRKEAEARRKATGFQNGGVIAGLGTATAQQEEQDASIDGLVASSEAYTVGRGEDFADSLAAGEEVLVQMPFAEQPLAVKSLLLPYQLQGLAWMIAKEKPQLPPVNSDQVVQLWKRKGSTAFFNLASGFTQTSQPVLFAGGILADDMGLGKTLQIISLIMAEGLTDGPTLIVAPVGVLSNWEQQIKFHVKEDCHPTVLVYHSCKPVPASEMRRYNVVITTYGMISSEFRSGNNAQRIFGVNWRRVVLDEAHTVRNPKSRQANAVQGLKAKSRWALTGTPIVNSVRDFMSLLQFLKITGGLQDESLFSQVLARPIGQLEADHPSRIKACKLLGHLMNDICLRRRKDMRFVDLKLPPKTEYIHRISFAKSEKQKYDAMLAEAQGALREYQKKSTKGQKGRYSNILERLLRLRQICNHWALCKERVDDLLALLEDQKVVELDNKNVAILKKALQLMIESQEECPICFEPIGLHQPVITACKHVFGKPCISKTIELQHKCPMCRHELKPESLVDPAEESGAEEEILDDICRSSKTEALVKIVEATLKKEGSKIIVFSQWTSFLNIIQLRLKEAGVTCTRIDGSMQKKARDSALESLDNNPDTRILLASLAVCGVGLNLVSADTVILSDSWWAPAIEDQAVDRVHRLGQTRPTTIWRLVVEGTVEERVLDIQAEKRKLVSIAFREQEKGERAKETRMADIKKLLSST